MKCQSYLLIIFTATVLRINLWTNEFKLAISQVDMLTSYQVQHMKMSCSLFTFVLGKIALHTVCLISSKIHGSIEILALIDFVVKDSFKLRCLKFLF